MAWSSASYVRTSILGPAALARFQFWSRTVGLRIPVLCFALSGEWRLDEKSAYCLPLPGVDRSFPALRVRRQRFRRASLHPVHPGRRAGAPSVSKRSEGPAGSRRVHLARLLLLRLV